MSAQKLTPVRIAPNNPVFDLPVIVGIEEGLFAQAGLEVSFSATYADRERDSAEGNFVSITYLIVAQSREQVTALVQELVATEGVLMVI